MRDGSPSKGHNVRRLARHLFTFVSVLSLLLFVAVCVLWLRSDVRYDQLGYTWVSKPPIAQRTYVIISNAGQCSFGFIAFELKQLPANPPLNRSAQV
jgi:hypothetical protein